MQICTGNVITVGKSLYIVHEITDKKMSLVDACHSNVRAYLSWKMIGHVMVACTKIEPDDDSTMEDTINLRDYLLSDRRVYRVAGSVKDYFQSRMMKHFNEFS